MSDNEQRAWAIVAWIARAVMHVAGVFAVFCFAEALLQAMR